MTISSNNKTIAKNTVFLYTRMLFSILVSLYTSRVVLQTLGISDYGIYGVVGGIVSMFSFLNAAMSGATSRFLTFDIGKGREVQLQKTFSSAFIVHLCIATIIFILSETVGLWILSYKLVIPEHRMVAAHIVYQCSIIGMFLSITQVPYNASIIAHEKMDVYAYVELFNVFLKLGIVYILLIGKSDKLILYALLVLSTNIIIALTYRIYCKKHYKECHIQWHVDLKTIRPMLVFSSWNILSECGYSFRVYGSNIVLNFFFGTIVNAATGIATTVQGILLGLVANVVTAVRPQIIMNYSSQNLSRMNTLTTSSIRLNLLLVSLVTIPIILDCPFIFHLWLGNIPPYSIDFCRLLLFTIYITSISQIVTIGIQATGNIKSSSIVRNIIYITTPLLIYIFLKFHPTTPIIGYIFIIISQMTVCLTDIWILHKLIPEINYTSIFADYFKAILAMILVVGLFYLLSENSSSIAAFFFRFIAEVFVIILLFWTTMFKATEKQLIKETLKKTLRKA